MTAKLYILLAAAAILVCTEGFLVRNNPTENIEATTATVNREPPQPPQNDTGESIVFPSESTPTATALFSGQANTTDDSVGNGDANSSRETTPTSQDATGEGELQPPFNNQYFSTDAATGPFNIVLPRDKFISGLHFWSPDNGTSLNVTFISSTRNLTSPMTTVLPRHWHSIDIYQPRENFTNTVLLTFRTEERYQSMEKSWVTQIQASSNDLIHWCFCPNAKKCALPATEEPDESKISSEERVSLVAALAVVVLLLVASLVALATVTFYRKAELFHIYAKPIDCITGGPPPLPKPNMEPTRRPNDTGVNTKLVEAQNRVTDKTDDAEAVRCSAAPVTYKPHEIDHESINNLYGLV